MSIPEHHPVRREPRGRHWRFIEWQATPKMHRQPATQVELAAELGVTDRAVTRWAHNELFQELVRQRVRELLAESLPNLYGALREQAEAGSFQHLKLALEMLGEHADALVVTHRIKREVDEVLDALEQELEPDVFERVLQAVHRRRIGGEEAEEAQG